MSGPIRVAVAENERGFSLSLTPAWLLTWRRGLHLCPCFILPVWWPILCWYTRKHASV